MTVVERRLRLVDHAPGLLRVVVDDGGPLPSQLATFAEAARMVGVDEVDIEDAVAEDGLPFYTLDDHRIIQRVAVDEVVDHFG